MKRNCLRQYKNETRLTNYHGSTIKLLDSINFRYDIIYTIQYIRIKTIHNKKNIETTLKLKSESKTKMKRQASKLLKISLSTFDWLLALWYGEDWVEDTYIWIFRLGFRFQIDEEIWWDTRICDDSRNFGVRKRIGENI